MQPEPEIRARTPEKRKRTRSPAYPAIGLREALEKANVLWQRATRHYVPDPVAIKYWNYDEHSSTGSSVIAAMKKFGLVDEEGAGANRQIKLSELAISLVYQPDISSGEYRNTLKKAALLPPIHSELWTRYAGSLPDNAVIERYLVVERKFNATYVKGFIEQFRDTIEFAGLSESDIPLPQQPGVISMRVGPTLTVGTSGYSGYSGAESVPLRPAPKQLRLDLDSGPVVLNYPMSQEDFDLLTSTLKLWEKKLVQSSVQRPELAEPNTTQDDIGRFS